ncbi:hypothetical protein [Paraburkholderia sp. J67]|uniref:hypothetical protein n=1 Tax=Paraburkholderia sp. J67 TaxID=2805435 RepID=UPI0039F4F87E
MKEIVEILRQFVGFDESRNLKRRAPALAFHAEMKRRPHAIVSDDRHPAAKHIESVFFLHGAKAPARVDTVAL